MNQPIYIVPWVPGPFTNHWYNVLLVSGIWTVVCILAAGGCYWWLQRE